MTKTYQLGDIYPDWESLKCLPYCTWEELKKSHGVTEDTLFVTLGGHFEHGTIIKLKDNDGTKQPKFTNGKDDCYKFTIGLSILPTQNLQKQKTPQPKVQIIASIDGEEYTKETLTEKIAETVSKRDELNAWLKVARKTVSKI